MTKKTPLALIAVLLVCGAASSQVFPGQAGFAISTQTASAGNICGFGSFTCVPDSISISAGDAIDMRITGQFAAPYLLLISAGASSCVTIPNVLNALVLDDPVTIADIGTLNQLSPILACPAGYKAFIGPFPALPPGFSFGLQAATLGEGGVAALTVAIVINVV